MTSQTSRPQAGIAAVLAAAILWGTTGTAATFATDVGPLAIGSVAMGSGGILQALLALPKILSGRRQIAANWLNLLMGALAVAVYPLTFYASMHYAGVAAGTVISIGSAPLLSALIEYYFDGQPLSRQWLVGAVTGVVGMVLLCIAEDQAAVSGDSLQTLFGMLLGLVAGFTYALYSWSARRMMHNGVNAVAAMGSTFGAGGLLLIPVLLLTGAPLLASATNTAVALYMALVPMFIGYLCYGFGLARIKASTATTLTLTEPVVAALLAVTLVGEHLPAAGWVGIGFIMLCLAMITLPARWFHLRRRVTA